MSSEVLRRAVKDLSEKQIAFICTETGTMREQLSICLRRNLNKYMI